ncbi:MULTISPECIES: hypothetical protein [unclassified Flavobacterium]|uniref:hypothetical protein n=1 Tax=unclassified Flavobacterium TaxID=196869 RepID=UPI000580816E|nr:MULTISPECIES: hypothetical protein [unclassified Flavobacterium]KIA95608.1 hypothetical protein OA93_17800 [Flavobacterium sp. KMS]OUL63433.1 hypothetical protein B8T70_04840 [Flavobacterium sp. AJR]
MGRTFYIAEIDGDTRFQHVRLNIIESGIYINPGIAFMGFMNQNFYFVNDVKKKVGLNNVEIGYVKYLYKIRNAYKNNTEISYTYFTGPNGFHIRERVFIAGKIFPVLNAVYKGENANPKRIEIRSCNFTELRLLFGEPDYSRYSINYISIDNDKIKIFLPKEEMGINYATYLFDFLTNGSEMQRVATHGEFPDKETCELARNCTLYTDALPPGCWLTSDREDNNEVWKKSCEYILEFKQTGILAPFSQIADFYKHVDDKLPQFGHHIRWTKGAIPLVSALQALEGGASYIENSVEAILSELNVGICDYAITQFYELFYGKYKDAPLTNDADAYDFDLQFVKHEQGVVAPPIYAKTTRETINVFQAMADKDPQGDTMHIKDSWHGLGSLVISIFKNVAPEFDNPWNGDVTDSGFRTDLPLLMLWLDRHKPTSKSFRDKVDANGYLKEKYKKIIRDNEYEKK